MVDMDYKNSIKLYIQKKKLIKALIFIILYQLLFLIVVILSLYFQLINIVYLIYFLDLDLIASIATYIIIFKRIGKKKGEKVLILSSTNMYPYVQLLIDKEEYLIGKKRKSVDGWIPHQSTVSRIHAVIIRIDNEFFIIDDESLNGTYLNNQRINQSDIKPLKIGDRVRFANIEFEVK
ncbi:FHA domain-containing protein [Intestinibacter sp.]